MTINNESAETDTNKELCLVGAINLAMRDVLLMNKGFASKISVTHLFDEDEYKSSAFSAESRLQFRIDFDAIDGFKPTTIETVVDITFQECHEQDPKVNDIVSLSLPTSEVTPVCWGGEYGLNYGHYSNNIVWRESFPSAVFHDGAYYGLSKEQDVSMVCSIMDTFFSLENAALKPFLNMVYQEAIRDRELNFIMAQPDVDG